VRVAPGVGPAVLGFLRADIVVPQSLLARSDEDQRLILSHEREHVRTRDHLLLGGAWLCTIVFPWHPAVWYLTNRVRLAIELDCDARVLRGGASPRSYGALLIDMAARQSAVRIGALALADGPSHLERRIRAMQWTRGRLSRGRGLMLGAVGGVLVIAACEAKVPTAADIASMDVASAQRTAAKAGFMRTVPDRDVDYFINGVRSSAEQANSLDAKKIGSVEVVKSEQAAGRDTIYVTTVDRMPASDSTALLRDAAAKMLEAKQRTDVRTRSAAQPVILIDGRKATMVDLSALAPSAIRSVNVLKKDGTGIDPDAANGVISIETRAKQK
jgi:hypothetical protein